MRLRFRLYLGTSNSELDLLFCSSCVVGSSNDLEFTDIFTEKL